MYTPLFKAVREKRKLYQLIMFYSLFQSIFLKKIFLPRPLLFSKKHKSIKCLKKYHTITS